MEYEEEIEEITIMKRKRGRPSKNGGHNTRVDVRLSCSEEELLKGLEERYGHNKSRSEIIRIALRTLYYTG